MTVPSFENLRLYILKHLANGGIWRKAQLVEPIAAHFNLSVEDIAQEYDMCQQVKRKLLPTSNKKWQSANKRKN